MTAGPEPEALYHDPALAALYDPQNADRARGGRPDFAFVRDRARRARHVLDLGCGTGELAASLAPGREVVGVDPAEAMLAEARRRPGGDAVRWVRADARDLDLGRRFDLIVLTGHAFQCFATEKDAAALLDAARRHLSPGGALIFDTRNPATRYWEGWTAERTAGRFDGPDGPDGPVRGVTEAVFDEATSVVAYSQTFTLPDGTTRRATARLRSARREDVEAALAGAGLRAAEVSGDWTGAPWREDSPEIVVVARHAGPARRP